MLKIKDGYLLLDTNITTNTKKKITGHSFVALANLDNFNKRGDAVLTLLGYYKSQVDPKYLYRGDMAEKMIAFILKKQNVQYISYDDDYKKKNHYDCFPNYNQCGGIPDFEIPSTSTIIETKSKSMSKYDEIKAKMPDEEVYQGLFYCFLRKYQTLKMAYIFFDEESEKLLFENKKPKTLDNCKVMFKKFEVNFTEMNKLVRNALNYYNGCIEYKAIPLEDISPKVLENLKAKGLIENNGL